MTTIIHSNGSKWAGEAPDTIADLLTVLANHPLDRRFEMINDPSPFIEEGQPYTRFFGNFLTVSHVFSIDTDEAATIEQLTAAIHRNLTRADYLGQADAQQRQNAEQAYHESRRQAYIAKKRAEAEAFLRETA